MACCSMELHLHIHGTCPYARKKTVAVDDRVGRLALPRTPLLPSDHESCHEPRVQVFPHLPMKSTFPIATSLAFTTWFSKGASLCLIVIQSLPVATKATDSMCHVQLVLATFVSGNLVLLARRPSLRSSTRPFGRSTLTVLP